jgi:uncharacterized protein
MGWRWPDARCPAGKICHGAAIPPRYSASHIGGVSSQSLEEVAMTPQERQLVADLFERLAALENEPRDPDAERAIREGLAQAPHAIYPLVQSVLVQDEALKQADARIRELEGYPPEGEPQQPRGFLDNMRDAVFGREEPRGSVPSVRSGGEPMGAPPQYRSGMAGAGGAGMQPGGMPQGQMQQEPGGRGGSFLGTAAAAAAGMVGGGLLLSGIRGMLGGGDQKGPFAGAFDEISGSGSRAPWGGSESGGDLAREAGIDDMGRGQGRAGLFDSPDDAGDDHTAGLIDTADYDADFEEGDIEGDFGEGGDTDTA